MGSGDPHFEPASKGFFEFLVESCPCGRAEICRPSQRPLPTGVPYRYLGRQPCWDEGTDIKQQAVGSHPYWGFQSV